jgi:hypothetical protein
MLSYLPGTPLDDAVELIEADAAPLNEPNVRNPHTGPFYRENSAEPRRNLLGSIAS